MKIIHPPFLALPFAALAAPAQAGVVQITATEPVVEITATQTVQSAPDEATISAGVTTRQQTAVAAMRQNATRMDAVITRIKSLGVAREDIQTSGVNLNPVYQYNRDNAPPTFLGYDVTNTVSVTLKKLDRIGETLDALVASGANNINGPYFRRADDSEARDIARKAAFEQARAQAVGYARMAGYSGVRLLEVNEALTRSAPVDIQVTAQRAGAAVKEESTPIEPGRVGTVVQMTAKYEMTR